MLGLGNALTRSINFGLLGEQTPFSNYPQLGTFGKAGIISYVEVDELSGEATIWEVLPFPILIPEGDNEFYSDTVANAYNYIYKEFKYIKDGAFYDNFTLPDIQTINGFFSYWRGNQNKFDDGFYFVPRNVDRIASDAILFGEGSINDTTVSGFGESEVYSTSDMFSKPSSVKYYTKEVLPSEKLHFLAARSYTEQLQYKDSLNLEPLSLTTKNVEDLDDDRYEYRRDEIDFLSNAATGYVPEPIHKFTPNTSVIAQPKNHQILFNVTVDVGYAGSPSGSFDGGKYLELLQSVEQPWWNSSEKIFMKCKVGLAGTSDWTYSQLLSVTSPSTEYKPVAEFNMQMRKVTSADVNLSLSNSVVIQDGVIVRDDNFVRISWVAECDLRTVSCRGMASSPQGSGGNTQITNPISGYSLETLLQALADASVNDFHYSKGLDTPIPNDRWWSVCRVRDVSFYTSARPESLVVEVPTQMQSVVVPMFPEVNIAGAIVEYGTDIDKSSVPFTFKEYIQQSTNTGESQDSDYINK